MNRNLDPSISQFLIGQSYLPLRIGNAPARELSQLERITLLLDLNLTDAAASYLPQIDDLIQSADHPQRIYAINLRARIHFDLKTI